MQTRRRRNFLVGGVAALTLATGVAFGGQAAWNDAYASTQPTALVAAAPVTAQQQDVAGIAPSQETLAKLYDELSPSVVNIQVTINTPQQDLSQGFPFPFPFPFGNAPFGQDNGQGQQAPQQQAHAEGTGFVYDTSGHIVTNNHVVAEADPENIIVNFANGEWSMAKLVARDPQADLAVLSVTPPSDMTLQPLTLAPADSLRVGYTVVAIGSPFGLDETMTTGIVSALGRSMPTSDSATGTPTYSLPDLIQTDAAINPGNSGGPLLDLAGEVVGVNFAINSPVRANSGVGFAIPASVIAKVVPALINDGAYHYAYLGIAGGTITAQVAQAHGLSDNVLGIYVGDVNQGGPAGKAGLQADDIITAIDNQPVHRFEDLLSYLFNQTAPQQQVTLHILRDGKAMTLDVTLGERPSEADQQAAQASGASVTIAKALQIAKQAVSDAGLMTKIDSATAKQEMSQGQPVWVVALSGSGKSATVVIDAVNGDVLELNVQ
ncbi:MAG: trypsin-like peptidase domain-containing protein [Caldilineaceae bacterium]|nr:trypsin-like peptidase domain-containing protein [Caldilineaceae bacterium]